MAKNGQKMPFFFKKTHFLAKKMCVFPLKSPTVTKNQVDINVFY
jgi:hypothetical protein